jgi:ankyrin repeat domain-containing protein 17
VVSLLLDRKANVEHRAKTGLTPLMEAASGGYVEVGRVLLDKGADVNAPPVPSSRDTALTIAADKGHTKFVELLLQRYATWTTAIVLQSLIRLKSTLLGSEASPDYLSL